MSGKTFEYLGSRRAICEAMALALARNKPLMTVQTRHVDNLLAILDDIERQLFLARRDLQSTMDADCFRHKSRAFVQDDAIARATTVKLNCSILDIRYLYTKNGQITITAIAVDGGAFRGITSFSADERRNIMCAGYSIAELERMILDDLQRAWEQCQD